MNHESDIDILIIGGGVAGMSAARVFTGQPVNVHLVEKESRLGGKAFDWACMATDKCEYCGACLSSELADLAADSENINIYTSCRIESLSKSDEGFHVIIKGHKEAELVVQAVIAASGFSPFDPGGLEFFEYDVKGVITTGELNSIIKNEKLWETLNSNPSPSIAFIQCVGSRNREIGNDYCSQVCCKTAVRFSNKILHLIPGASVTIFHMDLQTCGKMFRTQVSQIKGRATLVQGIPGKILPEEGNKLRIFKEDPETGARTASDFDMVVLTVGMESVKDNGYIINDLGAATDKWGFISDTDENREKRIYPAGAAGGPVDILTSIEQGISTAWKVLNDLGIKTESSNKNITVFGEDQEGRAVAKAMAEAGHRVHLFDSSIDAPPEHDGIILHPNTGIKGVTGTSGNFTVKYESDSGINELKTSAVIVASGSGIEPVSNEKMPESRSMIPMSELNEKVEAQNIVFWLDHASDEWKSNTKSVLDSAMKLTGSGKSVSILMEKMLVTGLHGQELYDSAKKMGIKFLRASSSDIAVHTSEKGIELEVKEATLSGTAVNIACDLLVVPEQISAGDKNELIADLLSLRTDGEGFLQAPNTRHRRTGSIRKGIFFAGSCHDETDEQDLAHEINIIKALIDLLPEGMPSEPGSAEIDRGKCGRCLTCFRVCPHSAIVLEGDHQPEVISDACFACGLCITLCPASAISLTGIDSNVQSDNPHGTLIYACKRSAFLAEHEIKSAVSGKMPDYKIIPVDCACSLDPREIIDRFANGTGKIMVMACHPGNCRSVHGDESARSKISRIYEDTGLTQSELSIHSIAANEPYRLKRLIEGKSGSQKENSHE